MEEKIYIVGAHSRAQTLGTYLVKLYPDIKIAAYLYDNEEQNRKDIKEKYRWGQHLRIREFVS